MDSTWWSRRTPAERAGLGVAGSLAAAGVVLWLLYLPAVRLLAGRRVALAAVRERIARGEASATEAPAEARRARELQDRYQQMLHRVESGGSMAHILEQISAQAKTHRLDLSMIQPRMELRDARAVRVGSDLTLREVPLTLRLTGRYQAIGAFLGGLPDAPYVAAVRQLTMQKPAAESHDLRAIVELAVFVAEQGPAG